MINREEGLGIARTLKDVAASMKRIDDRLMALSAPTIADIPGVSFLSRKTTVIPNKQDNSAPFQVGAGDAIFDFRKSTLFYYEIDTSRPKEFSFPQISVARSGYIYVDQPCSVNLPGLGYFDMKSEDTMTFENQEFSSFAIATARRSTAVRVVASESPTLPVELTRAVSARRIAGFDGSKISAQALDSALTITFNPQKQFALIEVGLKFTAAYTGTFTITKKSRYGATYDVRRLAASLTTANDTYWAPEPEFDFQKGDSLAIDLTAQASAVGSGEAVTDDR